MEIAEATNLSIYITIFGWLVFGVGLFFIFTALIGMLKMPDLYTKCHASGVSDNFGLPIAIIGIAIVYCDSKNSLKLILLSVLIFIVSPLVTHLLAKTAFLSGYKPYMPNDEEVKSQEAGK